jgi:hypothetical protein
VNCTRRGEVPAWQKISFGMLAVLAVSAVLLLVLGSIHTLYLKHIYSRAVTAKPGESFVQQLAARHDRRSRLFMFGIATNSVATVYAKTEALAVLAATDEGQDLICDVMSDGAGGELGRLGEQIWIAKLADEKTHVSKGCVSKLLRRLENRAFGNPSLSGKLPSVELLSSDTMSSMELNLLAANGLATVSALEERIRLGSGNPDPAAFQVIEILRLAQACPLLSSGLAQARISSSVWTSDYQQTFEKYCRQERE